MQPMEVVVLNSNKKSSSTNPNPDSEYENIIILKISLKIND